MADETTTNENPDRPAPSLGLGIAGAVQPDATRLAEHLGKVLVMQPLAHEEWDTSQGKSDVLVSQILVINGYNLNAENQIVNLDVEDIGETPVFWQLVKKQLDEQSTPETPWVIGKLVKGRRAYMIDPPTAEDLRAAALAVEDWVKAQSEEPF